uniref:Uncharacterized protein HLSG-g57b n=1 Tax=Haemaphysalis longicornis TaxID=44386 RepID=Q4R186_HAELO|nr:hypothetical protein [Haemaphysalis longicornis]
MQPRTLLFVALIAIAVNGEVIRDLKPAPSSDIIEARGDSEDTCLPTDRFKLRFKGAKESKKLKKPWKNVSSCTVQITCTYERVIKDSFQVSFWAPYGLSRYGFHMTKESMTFKPGGTATMKATFKLQRRGEVAVKKAMATFYVDCYDSSTPREKVEGYISGAYSEEVLQCTQG